MINQEVWNIVQQIKNEKIVRITACSVVSFTLLLAILYSFLGALIILSSYVLGFIICWSLIKYQYHASFVLQRLVSFYKNRNSKKQNFTSFCGICSNLSCQRHPASYNTTPWKNIYIDKNLNDAVEHFYNAIIDNFIQSWYSAVSNDETFLNELRYYLRYATASLLKKALELNVGSVVANKLIPCAIKHIDDYMYMQQIANLRNSRINAIAVEYLGNRLHIAATNRKNELSYLRNLTKCLLPHVFPADSLKCRNYAVLIREIVAGWVFLPLMDILADPNIINYLMIYTMSRRGSLSGHKVEEQEKVEFLCGFSNRISKKSSFATDMKTVTKNTDLLYAFMQFLKRERAVHLLQFCLDVDEFNNKLLTPDLSKKQLENLHKEAKKLYEEYFIADNSNFIGCSEKIVSNYKQLLLGGVYSVAQFRTSEPLYQAYEHALNILECDYLPAFFHSNEFFSHICGSKVTATYTKSSTNKNLLQTFGSPSKLRGRKIYEPVSQSTVAKISSSLNKIKGALRTNQPIEGAIYAPESQAVENGTIEDVIITDCTNIYRDLSSWRVHIPSVDATQAGSKNILLYEIRVERTDVVPESEKRSWTVQRRDQDFLTLKVKLIEFHGENEFCNSPFPPRRASTPINVRRNNYEEFLKSLLQKPCLKGSELLYIFLTRDQDFTSFVTTSVANPGDLGNIYQSVAYKLKKEKGQYLDSFMNTFLSSTGKTKHGKFEWAELGDEIDADKVMSGNQRIVMPKTFRNFVFNDNFGVAYDKIKKSTSSPFNPNNITESAFYLLKNIFKASNTALKLYAAICSVGQNAVDSLSRLYIEHKIKYLLSQPHLASLIKLLEDVIFDTHVPLTREEKEIRKLKAFELLDKSVPNFLTYVLGSEFKDGFKVILEILQNPLYNKQLVYNLVDIIVAEMYPQLESDNSQV